VVKSCVVSAVGAPVPTTANSTGTAAAVQSRRSGRLRAAGWGLRVATAGVLIVATAVLTPERVVALGTAIALLWLPLVGAVEAYRLRRSSRWGTLVAAVLDVALLTGALLWAPQLAYVVLLVQFPLAAHYGQTDRHPIAWMVSGAAVTLAIATLALVQLGVGAAALTGSLAVYAATVAGVLWMQRAAVVTHSDTSADLMVATGRADAVLSHIGDAVVVTGRAGRIRRMNPAAEQTFGCPTDAAVGLPCHEVLELRRDAAELDCSSGCGLLPLCDSAGPDGVEVHRLLPTGRRQPLLVTARAIYSDRDQVREVVHSFRDITELKRAEEAHSLFLATTTHELKTPLTVIRGFAETLELHPGMTEQQRSLAVSKIRQHTGELDRIVERILLSSRIHAGHVELTTIAGDLGDDLPDRIATLRESTGRPLHLRMPPRRPAVQLSPEAFTTVIDHLLENALKYSQGQEPVEVEVVVSGATVDVAVRDHGIGMTVEERRHCFDRFWQAEGDTARRFGGTGIGLYIVRSLVEAMGGEIDVDSEPGLGTTFVVRLRRADVDHPEPLQDEESDLRGERTMVDEFLRQAGLREIPS
jgi:PAS domain S-box-containing protein